MNEIIKIAETNGIKTCNARDLHLFLKSKRDFSNWILQRISKFGFIENEDYTTILLKNHKKGRPVKEYYLSLDMAKELSMVENNDKGKEARKYFIEVEKKYKDKEYIKDLVSKEVHRKLTDVIQLLGEDERQHGHAYSNITRLIYKKIGIENTNKDKKFREKLPESTLKTIAIYENLVKNYLEMGLSYSEIKELLPEAKKIKG